MAKLMRYQGILKMVGARQIRGNIVKTSVLEVGNEAMRNVVYTEYLSNYVDRALESGLPVAFAAQKSLGMGGPHIFAVRTDGKTYRDDDAIKGSDGWITLLCFCSLVTPGAVLTVPYLLYRFFWGKRADARNRDLAAQQL